MKAAMKFDLKAALVLAGAGLFATIPTPVTADGTYISVGVGYHSGHYGHRYKPGYGHHGHKSHKYKKHGYKSYGYHGRPHGHGYRHHKRRGYHHYGYRGYSSGDLAAAALVGGLIGYGVSSYRYQHRYKVYRRPSGYHVYGGHSGNSYTTYAPSHTVVVKEKVVSTPPARTLLKDRNGECYEIHRNALGDEIRVHLPSHDCNY